MTLHDIVLLAVAGVLGGTISALVGGAGLVTFPALLAVGLPPVLASAANLVALAPGNLIAALTDRSRLPPIDRSFVGLVFSSTVGAVIGAGLLLVTPEQVFAFLIPLLLGFATLLFALSPQITAWVKARAVKRGETGPHNWGRSISALLPVSIYGGYFGAGVGVLVLGVLSVGTSGDYRSANVTKNLVTGLNCMVASGVFIAQGLVMWRPTLAMMAGALLGSVLGGLLARVLPNQIARVLVLGIGTLLTVLFAWRYWF